MPEMVALDSCRRPKRSQVLGMRMLNMALSGKPETLEKSPGRSRGKAWKDKEVDELIEQMKEETIMLSLENAKTPKEKRAISNH